MRHCMLASSLRHVVRHEKLPYATPTCSVYLFRARCAYGLSIPIPDTKRDFFAHAVSAESTMMQAERIRVYFRDVTS